MTDGDEGYLVTPGDVEALSRAMERLIESESRRQTMGERARDRVRPLNLTNYGQQLANIYTALIEGTGLDNPLTDRASVGTSIAIRCRVGT